jgi:hypothetical protein
MSGLSLVSQEAPDRRPRIIIMAAMQTAGPRSLDTLGSRFNPFLSACVWQSGDEMPVSVLSALARLDLDAWGEASDLAQLPVDHAIERLSSLIERLPAASAGRLDSTAVAARLVALLPRNAASPPITPPHVRATLASAGGLIGMLIVTAILFSLNIIAANGKPPAVPQAFPSHAAAAQPVPAGSAK